MTSVAVSIPVTLPDLPDVGDHAIAGKATVPAVELIDIVVGRLADSAWSELLTGPLVLTDVLFPKFLAVDEIGRCDFELTVEPLRPGSRVTLSSRIVLANGMRRNRSHLVACFGLPPAASAPPDELKAECYLPAARVYAELVRFGPRFRSLCGGLALGPSRASGKVHAAPDARPRASLIGSPYLFDGAMHLACVWGQRYAGYVAYPTGFAVRTILIPTEREHRTGIVVPRSVDARRFTCDLWLVDDEGRPCDITLGLGMAPLASGPLPPDWIVSPVKEPWRS
jgi:hypothetical protein